MVAFVPPWGRRIVGELVSDWIDWFAEAAFHFRDDNGTLLAGHIAFTALLSLFPFVLFLAGCASFLGQETATLELMSYVYATLPDEVTKVVQPVISELMSSQRGDVLTLGMIGALWASTNGFEALRVACNAAFDVTKPKPLWFRRLQSLMLSLLLSLTMIFAALLIIAGPFILQAVNYFSPIELPDLWGRIFHVARYWLALTGMFVLFSALYWILPNVSLRRQEVLPGAIFSVIAWIVVASAFSLYLQRMANYTITYGSLAGIVVVLLFFYISSLIFLFGAELNAVIKRRADSVDA